MLREPESSAEGIESAYILGEAMLGLDHRDPRRTLNATIRSRSNLQEQFVYTQRAPPMSYFLL
jgi:hypothetical protein